VAGRATYTDEQKASAYVVLASNEGNIKRTSRDTGVPISTLRSWRDEWARLESLPAPEKLDEAIGTFADKAETIRMKALNELERQLHTAKPGDLIKIVGILDDKITRARGLADRTVEHRHLLPSVDELHALVSGFAEASRRSALSRAEDIIDAEVVEQAPRALLPG